jgi:hypothetical protein
MANGVAALCADAAADGGTNQLRRYAVLFDAYRGVAPWFLAVEYVYALLGGIATGLSGELGCTTTAWVLATLAFLFFATLVVLRPHAVRLHQGLQTLLAALQLAGVSVIAGVSTMEAPPEAALTVAEDLMMAASVIATVMAVAEAALVIRAQLRLRLRKLLAQRRHEDAMAQVERSARAAALLSMEVELLPVLSTQEPAQALVLDARPDLLDKRPTPVAVSSEPVLREPTAAPRSSYRPHHETERRRAELEALLTGQQRRDEDDSDDFAPVIATSRAPPLEALTLDDLLDLI